MKLKIEASEAQMVPCYKAGTIALEVDMSKQQVLLMLDEMAKQVKPQELVLMLDSVLEGVGVERVKPYQVRMADGTEMTIPAESSCLAMVQAQDQTGQFASSAKPVPEDSNGEAMAVKHTETKLSYRANGESNSYALVDDKDHWLLTLLHNGQQLVPKQEANLRRLVACWNKCDGVSTERLEDSIPLEVLVTRYNEVLRQRDALRVAMEDSMEWFKKLKDWRGVGDPNLKMYSNAITQSRAAEAAP